MRVTFRTRAIGAITIALTLLLGAGAEARVVRFVVEERLSFASGMEWGTAGPYERLKGTAYMEVDPKDPLNALIVNLDKAPRNARGMVEFSAPFLILKPVDMTRGNRKIWYGINNRGNCIELGNRAFPPPPATCNPMTAADVGANNVLLKAGYAIVDAGWHGDVPAGPNRLSPKFPVATQPDGSPIVGPARVEFSFQQTASFSLPLVTDFDPDEAADTNTAHSTLTVRDHADAPRVAIPSDRWAFGKCPTGAASLVPSTTDLCVFNGIEPRRIYELIYPAKNPKVMGLAYAVTRDVGSFLRYQAKDEAGNPSPLALSPGILRAYSSGTSSTGMYQREFLYLGFNEDESHRKVFDGVTIYSAGTHRLFVNVQFVHPTFFSGQDQHHDFTSNSVAPFTFAVTTDPVSGMRDGILKRPATDPLVFQIDEELVFWQWKASLNVIDILGHPIPVPDNVRLYFQNGYGHIAAAGLLSPPTSDPDGRAGVCQNLRQGGSSSAVTPRALAIAMDDWATRGIQPPKSNYPGIQPKSLVSLAEYRTAFPAVQAMKPPSVMNDLTVLQFEGRFDSKGGVQTRLPPTLGARHAVLVPRPDEDGVGVAGIRTIFTRAPLGTNAGWNLRPGFRAPDLCSLSGSFVPFAKTQAERLASGDSRKSLEERYKDHDGFVKAVTKATKELTAERFLLEEDAKTFISAAEASDTLR